MGPLVEAERNKAAGRVGRRVVRGEVGDLTLVAVGDRCGLVGVELDPSSVALDGARGVVVPPSAGGQFGADAFDVVGAEVGAAGGGDGLGEGEVAVAELVEPREPSICQSAETWRFRRLCAGPLSVSTRWT